MYTYNYNLLFSYKNVFKIFLNKPNQHLKFTMESEKTELRENYKYNIHITVH